jgi:hypothetical protein
MAVLIGIAAGMALASFLVAFMTWISIGNQIRELSARVKDYLLITPTSPGVQGAISARLFEAMKEVCETAKAHADAHDRWEKGEQNGTALMSDVEALRREWHEASRTAEAAVDRLKKIEETHGIAKR